MGTQKLKRALCYIPEVIFLSILAVIAAGSIIIPSGSVNYTAILINVLAFAYILTVIILKNKYLILLTSFLLAIGCLYMILAVLSEFHEFPAGDPKGKTLLITGISIFLGLFAMAVIMPLKYFKRQG